MKEIPEKFYKATYQHPIAYTVYELKEILSELPDELELESSFQGGIMTVVYNHGRINCHLRFEEVEYNDDED